MEHLDHPSEIVWQERQRWFEILAEPSDDWGGYLLSEQACALTADVQSAFCAGAWIAVIVLAAAVIDAHLREVEVPATRGNSRTVIDAAGADPRLHRLRKRRNGLVHVRPNSPAITVDQQWANRADLEREARDAVALMFETLYANPAV